MSEQIRVVVAEVGKPAEVREIDGDLKTMQDLVGGFIETLRLHERVFFVVNEEGRLRDLAPNRRFTILEDRYEPFAPYMEAHRSFTILGAFFVARVKGAEFVALSEKEAEDVRMFLDRAQVKSP